MKGAKGVIISITGGEDMRLMEVDEAASHIKELVDPDANIIWGSAFNNDLGGKIRVSVVATGIEADAVAQPAPAKVFSFPARQPHRRRAAASEPNAPAEDTLEVDLTRRRRRRRRAAARRRRHPDQPGRLAADRSARGRGRQRAAGGERRRHFVRAHVEHRPRRSQGADRRGRDRLSARADRHPALPQPAKQPVIDANRPRRDSPRGAVPFSLFRR